MKMMTDWWYLTTVPMIVWKIADKLEAQFNKNERGVTVKLFGGSAKEIKKIRSGKHRILEDEKG